MRHGGERGLHDPPHLNNEHDVQQGGIGGLESDDDQYPTFGGGAGVLIVVRDMDDMVDIEERPPGDVRPPIREEGELQRPPSTWRELKIPSKTRRFDSDDGLIKFSQCSPVPGWDLPPR